MLIGSQQVGWYVPAPHCMVSVVQRFCRVALGPGALELRTGNTLEMRTTVLWQSKQRLEKNFQTQSILEKREFIENKGLTKVVRGTARTVG